MNKVAEKSIANSIDEFPELMQWLNGWLKAHEVDQSLAYKICFSMEEIVTNAVYYGFPTGTSGVIKVRISAIEGKPAYCLEILDDGNPFNPLEESPEVDINLSLEERDIGGLGVFLVKNLTDDCDYQRTDGWNHLTLRLEKKA